MFFFGSFLCGSKFFDFWVHHGSVEEAEFNEHVCSVSPNVVGDPNMPKLPRSYGSAAAVAACAELKMI